MGRPPTPIGHYGNIHTKKVTRAKADDTEYVVWEARAAFRMNDGASKDVMRSAATKTAAVNRLKERLTLLADECSGGDITGDTRLARICDLWLAEFTHEHKLAGKSPTTPETYGGYVRNWIKPALGELQAREVNAGACDRLLQKARGKSYDTAASVRTVLLNVCGYAVRMGAMPVNPAKSARRLTRDSPRKVKGMTLPQRRDLMAKLVVYVREKQVDTMGRSLGARAQVWLQLPDVMEAMLSTGARLGELLALTGDDVDTAGPTVHIGHHLVREKGVGLVRLEGRKGNGKGSDELLLIVPQWSVPMWRRRKLASGGGPLFPSVNGGWLDPSNMFKKIRAGLNDSGFERVTSHVWRKTVGQVLDEAGLSNNEIADQLGNTPDVVEFHYRGRRASNTKSVSALEGMFGGPGDFPAGDLVAIQPPGPAQEEVASRA
ncbi:tyrosine-type recombinase/integrase [Amycolatopsis sp. GM8]|uniref:tyrosine-type recombinase/integrase n=1 Tax=Amycolatopsis sp. GM8 TaxID=2896530 RepID=UPI001F020E8C|nr:tyrosine-type recombinase/integrase [Amycolatopsis sp. GM8]